MRVIAFANQKGGVGKSTTTYHLARAAVLAGHRVLAVDTDPQGNLTSIWADVEEDQAGLADVLSRQTDVKLRDVVVPTLWSGLDLVPTPAGETLGSVRDELVVGGAGRERRLAEALETVSADYDLVLIDCPPSLDQLTMNALTAASDVAVVTQARLWATNGLAHLLQTIRDVRHYYNSGLRVAGVLINQFEERTVAGRHWREELTDSSGPLDIPVFDPPIPKRAPIADTVEAGIGLDEGDRDARALAPIYSNHLTTLLTEGASR